MVGEGYRRRRRGERGPRSSGQSLATEEDGMTRCCSEWRKRDLVDVGVQEEREREREEKNT